MRLPAKPAKPKGANDNPQPGRGRPLPHYGAPAMGAHSKLIRDTRNLAAARGHKLGEFILTRINTGTPPIMATRGAMVAVCEYCGASAAVDSSPPQGVVGMWGEAIERDCTGKVLA